MTGFYKYLFSYLFEKKDKEYKKWLKCYYSNWRFLAKWTKEKYSGWPFLSWLRRRAYKKHYALQNVPLVQYGVQIICEHGKKGCLDIGRNVFIAKDCFIDYTGDVIIKDNVQIAYGVVIQTHYHPEHADWRNKHDTVVTKIVIEQNAVIGSKAIIMASCGYIGKYARVGAGAVVTHDVPDYAVVVGSPARIIRVQEH